MAPAKPVATEDITIPCGRYDWLWARHVRGGGGTCIAVMIHGFPGDCRSYGDIFGTLAETLLKTGVDSVRFDMRGCGQSDKGAPFFSLRSGGEDCLYVLQWALKLGYKKFILIAEGLGAAAVMPLLTDSLRAHMAGMLLLWPVPVPQESLLTAAGAPPGFDPASDPVFGPGLRAEIAAGGFAARIPALGFPTLALYGTDDPGAAAGITALKTRATGDHLEIASFDGAGRGLMDPGARQAALRAAGAFFRKIA